MVVVTRAISVSKLMLLAPYSRSNKGHFIIKVTANDYNQSLTNLSVRT